MSNRIHRDKCAGLEVGTGDVNGGQELLPDVTGQHCLGAELDHAGCRKPPDGEEGTEVQILGEDHLTVAMRVLQNHAIGCIRLTDVDPVNGLVTRCRQDSIHLGLRFKSTRNLMPRSGSRSPRPATRRTRGPASRLTRSNRGRRSGSERRTCPPRRAQRPCRRSRECHPRTASRPSHRWSVSRDRGEPCPNDSGRRLRGWRGRVNFTCGCDPVWIAYPCTVTTIPSDADFSREAGERMEQAFVLSEFASELVGQASK